MPSSQRSSLARSLVTFAAVASATFLAPGCELATHFGDFQLGSDGGATDGGDVDGSRADGGDGGRDASFDANADVGPLPDTGMIDAGRTDGGGPTHTVTVTLSGAGTATLTSSDSVFTCSVATSPCSWVVPEGSLTVTSMPDTITTLTSWDGACTGTAIGSTSCTIDVTADTALGATYRVRRVTLDVGVTGVGTVTSTAPATLGISCTGSGTGCTAMLDAGTSITLHAAAGTGYTFSGWTLASCTGTGDCTFTINDDTTIDATFNDGRVAVRVAQTVGSDGNGIITADSGAIDCGGTCSDLYVPGATVVLTATPTVDSTFGTWTNCPSTPSGNTCSFTVPPTGAMVPLITASFTLRRFTLTVRRAGAGNGTITSAAPPINCGTGAGCIANNVGYGTVVTLTETEAGDSTFAGWAGVSGCGTDPTCMVTVTGNTTVTANYDLRQVHVTFAASPTSAGTGSITTDDGSINCTLTGTTTSGTCSADVPIHTAFTAHGNAFTGSSFTAWSSAPSGYCSGASTQCAFIAEEDLTISATFGLRHYDLNVTAIGTMAGASTGMGTVTFSMGAVPSCTSASGAGNTCTNNYAYNQSITLTATASGGTSVFSGWGGDCIGFGTMSSCVVTIAGLTNVTASFAPNVASLNVTTSGASQGTVSDGGAINCGAMCSATFPSGSTVTLTATPNSASGYVFTGWTGACASAGSSPMCTVTIGGATNVGANFSLSNRTITINLAGPPTAGRVVDSGGGYTCIASPCVNTYPYGTTVTLIATAVPGYDFDSWTGCPSPAGNACTFAALTTNAVVTANFSVQNVPVSVSLGGTGSGTVTSSGPAGINCHVPSQAGDVCSASVPSGTSITLTATPSIGSSFTGWTGGCSGTGPCTFTATAATPPIGATFSLQQFPLTVTRSPAAGGSVSSLSPTGAIACGAACTASYDYNTLVRLSASPNPGYRFTGWSVLSCGSASTCDITMTSAQNVVANFVQVRTLSVTIPAGTLAVRSASVTAVSPTGFSCVNTTGTSAVTCTADYDVGTVIRLTSVDTNTRYFGATSWSFSGVGASAFCGTLTSGPQADCTFTMPAGAGNLNLSVPFGQLGNIVFITDATYAVTVDFTGPGQADNACRLAASAAGLPGSTYTALLSTSGSSSSFTARIMAPTPQPSGWVRVDGRPVATDTAQLLGGALIHPIDVTQTGAVVPTATFWSNTLDSGGTVSSTNNCSSWGSSSGSVAFGHAGRTSRWASDTNDSPGPCNVPRRFVCFQNDGGAFTGPVRPAAQTSSFIPVFTTVSTRTGDATLASLDALCAAEASSASLGGTWVAFVSTVRDPAQSRTMRTGPLVRTDGWPIGPMTAWTGGAAIPATTFAVGAAGQPIVAVSAWTGMPAATGAAGSQGTCGDWADGAMNGNVGFPASIVLGEWAATSTSSSCTRPLQVMCIQQ